MTDFDYPVLNSYPEVQRHDNFPYQNFFRANPLSDQVQIDAKEAGYVQPREIKTMNVHGPDPQWIGSFQVPCGTILPKSLYYYETNGIILPP